MAGLTQTELADRAKVSRDTVRRLEKFGDDPLDCVAKTQEALMRVIQGTDLTVKYVVGKDGRNGVISEFWEPPIADEDAS